MNLEKFSQLTSLQISSEMSLQAMPTEIIQKIVGNIPQTKLIGLLKSCRRLHSIIEPIFYSTLNTSSMSSLDEERSDCLSPLHFLLRTLLSRPALGHYTKTYGPLMNANINLTAWASNLRASERAIRQCYGPDLKRLGERAEVLAIGEKDLRFWRSTTNMGPFIFSVLLISFFPELRHLNSLAAFPDMLTDELDLLPKPIPMVRRLSDMQHLKNLNLTNFGSIRWNSDVATSIFNLPNIESIDMTLDADWSDRTQRPKIHAPKLRRLHLVKSVLFVEAIKCIVSSTTKLEDIGLDLIWAYQVRSPDWPESPSGVLNLTKLGEALAPSVPGSDAVSDWSSDAVSDWSNPLRCLELKVRVAIKQELGVMVGRLGSFKHCSELRSLKAQELTQELIWAKMHPNQSPKP